MTSLFVFIGGLLLTNFLQAGEAKINPHSMDRKVAQESKVSCVPLGQPFLGIYDEENGTYNYTSTELRVLRNSIFAQYGYPFVDKELDAELKTRKCDAQKGYNYKKMAKVDKENVVLIKYYEEELKAAEKKANFNAEWDKADGSTREGILKSHYCYLSNPEGKLVGVIYFNNKKYKAKKKEQAGGGKTYVLEAMMNVDKPNWAAKVGEYEEKYTDRLRKREMDASEFGWLFDYNISGTWGLIGKNVVVEGIYPHVAGVSVSGEHFAKQDALDCKLSR